MYSTVVSDLNICTQKCLPELHRIYADV